ncbi:MAG TPA: thioredoxin family protein [Thermoanaerobaculia bacterium]|nr:thioredoxin family protein [Thermoanaerobaculia bacterium]
MTQPIPSTPRRSAALLLTMALAATLAGAGPGAAQVPSDAVLRGFQPIGDYVLAVGGKDVKAEIYQAEAVPAILVISSALTSPVLLLPRQGTVETVHIMKVAKQKDGSIDLLADAVLEPQGQFQAVGDDVSFTADGKQAQLKTKPPLLGAKSGAALRAYSPSYVRGAQTYKPNGQQIAALKKAAKPVKVRVFFGSWCPFCKQYLPYLLKVEEQLKGSKVQIEYFGLPRDLKNPEAQRLNVRGVPVGIVYVNGREVGRISGDGWKTPEATLAKIVARG